MVSKCRFVSKVHVFLESMDPLLHEGMKDILNVKDSFKDSLHSKTPYINNNSVVTSMCCARVYQKQLRKTHVFYDVQSPPVLQEVLACVG